MKRKTAREILVDAFREVAGSKDVDKHCEKKRAVSEDLPDDWKCPRCKQPKEKFNRA